MRSLWTEQVDMTRNLKGAGASIILIMIMSGRSLTNKELQKATKYSDKPITEALEYLEERGIVHYVGRQYGWTLGGNGVNELPIGAEQIEFLRGVLGSGGAGNGRLPFPLEDRSNSDPVNVVVNHVLKDQKINTNNNNMREDRKVSDLLGKAGVTGSANSLISRSGVDPEIVAGWFLYSRTKKWMNNPAGYVVKRLTGDDAPEMPPADYLDLGRAFVTLGVDEWTIIKTAVTGYSDGVYIHAPAKTSDDVTYWMDTAVEIDSRALNLLCQLNADKFDIWGLL